MVYHCQTTTVSFWHNTTPAIYVVNPKAFSKLDYLWTTTTKQALSEACCVTGVINF
jgi:hypothetical protein